MTKTLCDHGQSWELKGLESEHRRDVWESELKEDNQQLQSGQMLEKRTEISMTTCSTMNINCVFMNPLKDHGGAGANPSRHKDKTKTSK